MTVKGIQMLMRNEQKGFNVKQVDVNNFETESLTFRIDLIEQNALV
jgi:hypothetical protein